MLLLLLEVATSESQEDCWTSEGEQSVSMYKYAVLK
jgi:hypothetical protein